MRPESLSVVLRPRGSYEAIDLGMALARRAGVALFAPVGIGVFTVGALTVAAMLLLGPESAVREWGWIFVWWLKPVYDRAALHVLSRDVFGARPTVGETLRAMPGLAFDTRLLAALTWRRLSPLRALYLPVDQLERLRGRAGRDRRRLIGRRVSGAGIGLIFACSNFELVMSFGAFGLVALVQIEALQSLETTFGWLLLGEESLPLAHSVLFLAMYCASITVLEPFYVAGGFGLYLKRRTDLEAWDVEVALRRVSARPAAATVAAALAIALLVGLPGGSPQAQEPAARDSTTTAPGGADRRGRAIEGARTGIGEVLAAEEFGKRRTVRTVRMKERETAAADPDPGWLVDLINRLLGLAEVLGYGVRILVYVGLALLLVTLGWRVLREMRANRARVATPPPTTIGGFDIRPRSLPDDIPSTASALAEDGRVREALALLYRGALSRLAHHRGVSFRASDTERECLVRVAEDPARDGFARLVGAWQRVAYAADRLSREEAERLCHDWRGTFGSRE